MDLDQGPEPFTFTESLDIPSELIDDHIFPSQLQEEVGYQADYDGETHLLYI